MNSGIENVYTWPFDATAIFVRYFVLAGVAYFVLYLWKRRQFAGKKIQRKNATASSVRIEILYSSLTLVIYCATSWVIFELQKRGLTRIYSGIHQYGISYFVLSVIIMVVLHDTYFYWVHRLMHLPRVFKWVHQTHHRSDNPTPWAAFAFHPWEAVLSVGIIPLIVFVIPCHPFALFSFLTYMTLINVMGHLGYELFPVRFTRSRIGKWHNTSTNHNIHHQSSRSNFGLYFTFWDLLMKTYESHDRKVR